MALGQSHSHGVGGGFTSVLKAIFFLKISFIYFLERGEGRERGRETSMCERYCLVVSRTPPTGDLAHNPGRYPDWESNQQPSGSQAGTPSTEPHQPGLKRNSNAISSWNGGEV